MIQDSSAKPASIAAPPSDKAQPKVEANSVCFMNAVKVYPIDLIGEFCSTKLCREVNARREQEKQPLQCYVDSFRACNCPNSWNSDTIQGLSATFIRKRKASGDIGPMPMKKRFKSARAVLKEAPVEKVQVLNDTFKQRKSEFKSNAHSKATDQAHQKAQSDAKAKKEQIVNQRRKAQIDTRLENDRIKAKRTLQEVMVARTKEEVAARLKLIHQSSPRTIQERASKATLSKPALSEITNTDVKKRASTPEGDKKPAALPRTISSEITNKDVKNRVNTPEGDKKPAARPVPQTILSPPSMTDCNMSLLPFSVDCRQMEPLTEAAVAGPESRALIEAGKAARAAYANAKKSTAAKKTSPAKKASPARKASPVKHSAKRSPSVQRKKFRFSNNSDVEDVDFGLPNDHMDIEDAEPFRQQAGGDIVMEAPATPVVQVLDQATIVGVPAALAAVVAPVTQPRRRRRSAPRMLKVSFSSHRLNKQSQIANLHVAISSTGTEVRFQT